LLNGRAVPSLDIKVDVLLHHRLKVRNIDQHSFSIRQETDFCDFNVVAPRLFLVVYGQFR
jgi:hypothetical protein